MNKPLRIFFLLVGLGLVVYLSALDARFHARVYHDVHEMGHGTPPGIDVQLAQHLFRDLRAERMDDARSLFTYSRAATSAPLARLHDLLESQGQPTLTGWIHERYLRTHHTTVLSYQFGHGDLARQALIKSKGTERTDHLSAITIRNGGDIEARMRTSSKLLTLVYFIIGASALVALLMAIFGKRPRDS